MCMMIEAQTAPHYASLPGDEASAGTAAIEGLLTGTGVMVAMYDMVGDFCDSFTVRESGGAIDLLLPRGSTVEVPIEGEFPTGVVTTLGSDELPTSEVIESGELEVNISDDEELEGVIIEEKSTAKLKY